jgi:hypothetical protein
MTLAAQQQAFVDAVLGQGAAPQPRGLRQLPGIEGGVERGLQAYRGNAQGLAVRALAGVFPRLHEALADNDFDTMAWAFWRRHVPTAGDLGRWGGDLAEFLAAQPGMDAGLVDLARLEWAQHEAESAADEVLDPATLSLLGTQEPEHLRLRLSPGLTVLAQSDGPVLVWRRAWRALSSPLAAGDASFMRALIEGQDLHHALLRAGVFDFSNWLQQALREGWLLRIEETR